MESTGLRLDERVRIPAFSWEGGQRVSCRPVELDGFLRPSRRGIEFTGRGRTVATLTCVRCLEEIERTLELEFRLFVVADDAARRRPDPEAAADDPDAVDLYPIDGEELDVAEVLREQIDLLLPFSPVCSEDCRGLCAGCGASLNNEECHCRPEVDERWSALERISSALSERRDPGRSGGRG